MTPREGEDLAERARRSGIDGLTIDEREALRMYLLKLRPAAAIREAFGHADRAAERVVDEVWTVMGDEPTAGEYMALGRMFEEAAKIMRNNARERSKR